MFNSASTSISSVNNIIKFSGAASGIVQKSHAKSWFRKMHNESELAKTIFSNSPHYVIKENISSKDIYGRPVWIPRESEIEILVLQVLLMSNDWLMVELLHKSDYE